MTPSQNDTRDKGIEYKMDAGTTLHNLVFKYANKPTPLFTNISKQSLSKRRKLNTYVTLVHAIRQLGIA